MPARVPELVEEVFRRESGRVLATVMRLTGDLDRAEEIVQETLVTALERWPGGVPENPGAWLMTAAKNRALDQLRRAKVWDGKVEAIAREAEEAARAGERADAEAQVIDDDRLRLIFLCCHPALPRESQVAITLRLVAGLSTGEIARGFLATEATIAQRIVRAKRVIRDGEVAYEAPPESELPERLPPVLEVIYLVFNEGYTAGEGEALVRGELCDEAIRLGGILAELMPEQGEALGLLALMELQASRAGARTDGEGNMVLLEEQDRARWDRGLIERGLAHLERGLARGGVGSYRLQAAIAACHARAESWGATDWRAIAGLYGTLEEVTGSPVVALNRAVAVGLAEGAQAGLALLDGLVEEGALEGYHHLPAARGDLLRRLGRFREAAAAFEEAIGLTKNQRERDFLARRLAECEQGV